MGVTAQRKPRGERPATAAIDANAAGLAHALANLAQVVNGNLELIAARTTDEPSLRYLENARAAAHQLTELARKLRGE